MHGRVQLQLNRGEHRHEHLRPSASCGTDSIDRWNYPGSVEVQESRLSQADPQAITGRIVQILAHTQIPFRGDDRGVPEAQLNAGFRG
jgi:hypothetical protein